MKVNFQALGCRLNEAELERWSSEFIQKGHQITTDSKDADLIIFNSCSVTAEADRKSRNQINKIHKSNPDSKLVVTGCYASLQAEQVKRQIGVDLVIPNTQKEELVSQVQNFFDIADILHEQKIQSSIFTRGRHRAFIKVQDGCRYRCTFCIVTVARGEERSQSIKSIINEINQHHEHGVQEVVITGVHVGGYGSDIGSNLYQLLNEILDKTTIPRVRLASVEPWDLPDNFFDLFKDQRLMPHMHLPLQSGADSVLRRMARRCKTGEFAGLIEKARSAIPDFNITTDIIVGFPGETEKEWAESLRFVEQTGFGHIHIFSYSARAGTKASRLPGQLPKEIKKQRNHEMHYLANQLKIQALDTMLGKSVDVLWENATDSEENIWTGYSPQYFKVTSLHDGSTKPEISSVKVTSIDRDHKSLIAMSCPPDTL